MVHNGQTSLNAHHCNRLFVSEPSQNFDEVYFLETKVQDLLNKIK